MQLNRLPPTIPRPTLQRQGSLTPDQITEELRRLAYSRGVRVSSKLQTLVSMVADHQYPYKSSINTADVNRLWATLQDQARSLRNRQPNDPAVIDTLERSLYVSRDYPTQFERTSTEVKQRISALRKGTILFPRNNTGQIIDTFQKEHGLDTLG